MNTFANSLFSLLFGWTKDLIQRIWTGASTGAYSGFFIWLGDHWMWVVLLLCAAGTALDFMVWMARWRPYLVWRSNLRRFRSRLRLGNIESARNFKRGYAGGIELDMQPPEETEETPAPVLQWEEPENAYPQQEQPPVPSYQQPLAPSYGPVGETPVVYAQDEAAYQESANRQRQFTPAQSYEAPPLFPSTRHNSAYTTDLPAARRRRRSEKYERKKPVWADKLIGGDEEDRLLDGLPPAVDRQQAFHEPVYPRQAQAPAADPYAAWQRPEDTETGGSKR